MSYLSGLRKHRAVYYILVFYGLLLGSITFVNHQCFRTYALDLGLLNSILRQIMETGGANLGIIGRPGESFLADHFSPVLYLLAPLSLTGITGMLLLIQWGAVLLGGYCCYLMAIEEQVESRTANWMMIYWFSLWGIYSAIAYDAHMNVIASALIPVAMYLYNRGRWIAFVLIFLLTLSCKENMGLIMGFVCLAMWVEKGRRRSDVYLPVFAAAAIVWSLVVVGLVMPSLAAGEARPLAVSYGTGEGGLMRLVSEICTHPLDSLWRLVGDERGLSHAKIHSWIWLLISGGVLLFFRPWWLLACLPVCAQKFLSTREELWDIHYQYSMEFVPILVLMLIYFVARTNIHSVKNGVPVFITFVASYMTFRDVIQQNVRTNFLAAEHYHSVVSREELDACLQAIEAGEKLSCSSALVPHLVFRYEVREFPVIDEANFIIIAKYNENLEPLPTDTTLNFNLPAAGSGPWARMLETPTLALYHRISEQ